MTTESIAIANVLLKNHREFCRDFEGLMPESITDKMVKQSVIPYRSLCKWAGVPFLTDSIGRFLSEVGEWCEENGWPLLNSLAVNRETGLPSFGYDAAHGGDLSLWPEHVRKCIAFAGYPKTVPD